MYWKCRRVLFLLTAFSASAYSFLALNNNTFLMCSSSWSKEKGIIFIFTTLQSHIYLLVLYRAWLHISFRIQQSTTMRLILRVSRGLRSVLLNSCDWVTFFSCTFFYHSFTRFSPAYLFRVISLWLESNVRVWLYEAHKPPQKGTCVAVISMLCIENFITILL